MLNVIFLSYSSAVFCLPDTFWVFIIDVGDIKFIRVVDDSRFNGTKRAGYMKLVVFIYFPRTTYVMLQEFLGSQWFTVMYYWGMVFKRFYSFFLIESAL